MKKTPREPAEPRATGEVVPLESRAVAKPTKAPSTWRAFNRFVADVDELLEYKIELYKIFSPSENDDVRTPADIEGEAEFCQGLVARCRTGLERFDHTENYEEDEDGERVLRHSHIAKRVGVLVASFPNANPSDVDGYVTMLVEHIGGTAVSELSLETACREIVETQKFAPAISEAMSVINKHIELWRDRRCAIKEAEGVRLAVIRSLRELEQKRKQDEHAQKINEACRVLKRAMESTRWLQSELAKLRERLAQAEQAESEAMRALRKLTMTEEEQEAAAEAKLDGSGCGELSLH
jgi:SPX domain protein involved in polyphosphate accumulation